MQGKNLVEAVHEELSRVRELIYFYNTVPAGFIAAGLMEVCITKTIDALSKGDVIALMKCYKELKGFQ